MLDLADAESVKRWISIAPERHIAVLRGLYRLPMMSEFRSTIEMAVKQHKSESEQLRA